MGTLIKETVIDKIEILENGLIQTREETRILEDGVIISRKYTNRRIIEPGQDVTKEDQRVKDIAGVVHKPEVITNYLTKAAERLAAEEAKK